MASSWDKSDSSGTRQRKPVDLLGKDLPLYQPELADLKDLARLREINPMVMSPKLTGAGGQLGTL
jgi:hypothetical protein